MVTKKAVRVLMVKNWAESGYQSKAVRYIWKLWGPAFFITIGIAKINLTIESSRINPSFQFGKNKDIAWKLHGQVLAIIYKGME